MSVIKNPIAYLNIVTLKLASDLLFCFKIFMQGGQLKFRGLVGQGLSADGVVYGGGFANGIGGFVLRINNRAGFEEAFHLASLRGHPGYNSGWNRGPRFMRTTASGAGDVAFA